ncbi:MAG: ParB N-terminal domain-containing protein [Ruminococcus sp.]|nr:ParB N-terminal domain-containing protein [Ruminococcus sp.]
MARKFQVDNAIAADIKSAASDSFKDNIRMIEIGRIKTSMDNFYSMNDIEILADDIERQGLKHNLVVAEDSENPDTYFIKSGHRRFAAIQHLISENRYGSKFVPCLIDGVKSHSENILDLIMLNATARVMSDSELFKQYKTLKETLEQLKNDGIKIKGRLREKIAEMLNISSAQAGKIENIKHNAIDEVKEAVESGDMSIAVADSLAKLPEQEQKELITDNDISEITTKDVKNHKEKTTLPKPDLAENTAPETEDMESDISDIADSVFDDSDTYECENQEELIECDDISESEKPTAYIPHWDSIKWDGDMFGDEIKVALYFIITQEESEQAITMSNSDFADLIKNNHQDFHKACRSLDILCTSEEIKIRFIRIREHNGINAVTLTWSMAARHIRAWKLEEQEISEKNNQIIETNNEFSDETVSDTIEKDISDKTEIYRSKLLELNSEFEKLIKSADTTNTIQQIAVDMINKISDIQMEVTNG